MQEFLSQIFLALDISHERLGTAEILLVSKSKKGVFLSQGKYILNRLEELESQHPSLVVL